MNDKSQHSSLRKTAPSFASNNSNHDQNEIFKFAYRIVPISIEQNFESTFRRFEILGFAFPARPDGL